MTIPLLAPERRMLVIAGEVAFAAGRVHEICGPSRRVLALMLAAMTSGAVAWAQPTWQRERLFPHGVAEFLNPGRIILAACRKPVDLLWTMEECLRSGAVGAVVAELSEPPGLTPVRRLQLAAEAGGQLGTGVLLTPGMGGAPGVESRWHCAADPLGGWRLRRLRARMAPEAAFHLRQGPRGIEVTPLPV